MASPILESILEFQINSKNISSYLERTPLFVRANKGHVDDKVPVSML